jgi:hypothetical protein
MSCPNLVILLDQSASMAQTPSGTTPMTGQQSKWDIATAELTSIVNKYASFLPLGYSNFPYQNASCDTRGFFVVSDGPDSGKLLSPAYGNSQDIYNAMHSFPTATPWSGGSTPTCTAVSDLASQMQLQDPSRGQYILLVTDGAPEAVCCPTNPVQATVTAIANAAAQNPPVKTFVVGFGVVSSDVTALNQMAMAGGVPATGSQNQFYVATDQPSLDSALNNILAQLLGGDAGEPVTCEDGCYGTPCPSGQVCLQNQCVADPCASQTCPANQACLFTGGAGSCVAACVQSCPLGARCDNGSCVADPCSGTCGAGQVCDASNGQCVTDPSCQNVICHRTQGCFGGQCMDDPCVYTTCPSGTQCIPFSGQCMAPRNPANTEPSGNSGCQFGLTDCSHASELGPLATLLALSALMLVSLRRRRRHFDA